MKKRINDKINQEHVHEHLEYVLQNTTYTDRMLWLTQVNEFVNAITKKKIIKKKYY